MSKIICDVCGTTYPETATQCPICGFARPADTNAVPSEAGEAGKSTGTYTYVKGGRFSKANVRKRNRNQTSAARKPSTARKTEQKRAPEIEKNNEKNQDKKSDRGLIAVVIILILAIIGVAIYIGVKYFLPEGIGSLIKPEGTTQSTEDTNETPPLEIPCTDLRLSHSSYTMTQVGEGLLLSVTAEPSDTTDTISFESSDTDVVTVSASGNIVAVGPGEATISITCGDVVKYCNVTCDFEVEPPPTEDVTEPTGEGTDPSTEPTVSAEEIKLNRTDITFSKQGESWMLYEGSIPVGDIKWTSDDESIATIQNGRAVAVGGPGYTTVHGEYNGVKVSCIIRCSFTASSPGLAGNGGVSEDGPTTGAFTINYFDVTLHLSNDNEFLLQLRDSAGALVSVEWIVENDEICSANGNRIIGKAIGTTTVYTIHEGQRYSCIVRVYA